MPDSSTTREVDRLFDTVLATAPLGVAVFDPQLTFIRISEMFSRMTGLESHHVAGQPLAKIAPMLAGQLVEPLNKVLSTGKNVEGIEVSDLAATGMRLWRARGVPLRDAERRVAGVILYLNDITEMARAEDALRWRERQLKLRADVSTALALQSDLSSILDRCCTALVKHLDAAFARIWTIEDRGTMLFLRASAGLYTHLDGPHSRVAVGKLKIGQIAQNRTPHITNDIFDDPYIDKEWAHREGIVAFAGYPLLVEGRSVGVVAMFARHRLRQSDVDALGSAAEVIAQGVERRRLDDALVNSRDQLAAILRGVSEGITAADPTGRLIYANQAAAKICGFASGEDLLQLDIYRLAKAVALRDDDEIPFGHDDLASSRALKGELVEDEIVRLTQYSPTGGGSVHWVIVSAAPVLDRAGQVTMAITVFRDITEQKHVEEAWKLLADLSAALGSSLDAGQMLTAVAEHVVPELADWCSIDVQDVESQRIEQAACAHVTPRGRQLLTELRIKYPSSFAPFAECSPFSETSILRSRTSPEELELLAIDPRHLELMTELGLGSSMCVPLRVAGRVFGAMTLGSAPGREYGVADLMLAEEVARRCAVAVENAQLYAETRNAVALRDQFLSIASHELKTPLTSTTLVVQSMISAASRKPEGLPSEQILTRGRKIEAQLQKFGTLIDQLLDVSRISAGRLEIHREELELGHLIHEVVERFAEQPNSAELRFKDETGGSAIGSWDRLRVDQVLTNLISNAVKYGGKQPIDITVTADDHHATIIVRDRGMGIPAEDQQRIFDRFVRLTSAGHYGGFGLGLWIVRQIIEALGGTIQVESVPHEGSAFIVKLPKKVAS